MVYFAQNIKGVANDFKEFLLPIIRRAAKILSPKTAILFIFKALQRFFLVGTPSALIVRMGILGCFLAALYLYLLLKRRQAEALKRKIARAREPKLTKTSEEFWQN